MTKKIQKKESLEKIADIPELSLRDIFEIIRHGFNIDTVRFVVPVGIKEDPVLCKYDTQEILINSNPEYRPSKKINILKGLYAAKCFIEDIEADDKMLYKAAKNHYEKLYHSKPTFPETDK